MSGDLKAVFGQKDDGGGEEDANWDQVEGDEEDEEVMSSLLPDDPGAKKEESSGFTFSFFGDDMEPAGGETSTQRLRFESWTEGRCLMKRSQIIWFLH